MENRYSRLRSFAKSVLGVVTITVVLAFFGLIVFRIGWLTWVDNYEIGYVFDTVNGKMWRTTHMGYVYSPPFVQKVHTIDGRPMQVNISAINRVLNAKLVRFNPEGLELFLKWHGRGDYDNSGTISRPSLLNQILSAYAFEGSGKAYPFLTVIRDLKPSEVEDIRQ